MGTTAIGLRCASIGPRELALAHQLCPCFDEVVFLLDPQARPAAQALEDAQRLGMVATIQPDCLIPSIGLPGDWAWRCGDLALLALQAHLRNRGRAATHYWLIESDVGLHLDAEAFFDACAARPEDLLAKHIRPASAHWRWHDTVAPFCVTPWRCDFPLLRISDRALDACRTLRMTIHEQLQSLDRLAPNDESLVASCVIAQGYSVESLEHLFPEVFHYYSTVRAFPDTPHCRQQTDGSIVHSLLPMNDFIRKNFVAKLKHVQPPDHAAFLRHRIEALGPLLNPEETEHIVSALILGGHL
ncbi:hypothetical protein WAE61_05625 [Comamonadaceae bacterium PP-2]